MPRKKTINEDVQSDVVEDFIVVSATQPKADEPEFSVEEETNRLLLQAMKTYNLVAKQSSAFLEEKGSYTTPTQDEMSSLAEWPQDNLAKTLRINSIISKYTNLDDVLGTVVEAIRVNLNDEFRLTYKNIEGRNNLKKLERVKAAVNSFNDDIGLQRLIREFIPRAYLEGTVITYLRNSDAGWVIDTFPLGIAQISPYSVAGEPIVLIDMNELRSRLNKTKYRSKSSGALFFDNVEEEIRENFCKEIYDAYVNKDQFAKLDVRYTGVMRVGNHGRRYGLSPLFKAIPSSMLLESFQISDMKNAKVRSKKMVYQLLDPVLLGQNGERNPIQQQQYAHTELIAAYSRPGSVLYTAPGYVKSVNILEPKGEMVDKDTVMRYTYKEMSSIGIAFTAIDSNSSISGAKISLEQLMRNINSIGKTAEDLFAKYYRQMLIDENLPPEYAPQIKIIDSEALDLDMKSKLVEILYSKLNCSLHTALETLGYDATEEYTRRKSENEQGIERIFYPRESLYTKSGDSGDSKETGRPQGEENDKQDYDENYQDSK